VVSSHRIILWQLNSELFVLTYGSVVAQLCKDTDDANEVNKQLDKMYSGVLEG